MTTQERKATLYRVLNETYKDKGLRAGEEIHENLNSWAAELRMDQFLGEKLRELRDERREEARRVVDVPASKGLELSAPVTSTRSRRLAMGSRPHNARRRRSSNCAFHSNSRARRLTTWNAVQPIQTGRRRRKRAQNRLCRRPLRLRRIRRGGDSGRPSRKQQSGIDAPFQCEGLSGCGGAGGESIAPRWCQWPLRPLAGRRRIHGRQRGKRRRVSCPSTYSGSCRWRDRLGPSHRRWLRAYDSWR